jgi:hypothetical protein
VTFLNKFNILDLENEPIKSDTSVRVMIQATTVVLDSEKVEAELYGKAILILYVMMLVIWIPTAIYTKTTLMPALSITWFFQYLFFTMSPFFAFSPKIKHFFSFFRAFTFEFLWLDHFFSKSGLIDHVNDTVANQFSNNMTEIIQYKFANFLTNNSSKILIWLFLASVFALSSYLNFLILNCTKWRIKAFHQIKNAFLFNIPMVFISFCCLPFGMSLMLEMRLMTMENNLQLNSFALCGFMLFFFFYLTIGMGAVMLAYNGKYNVKML